MACAAQVLQSSAARDASWMLVIPCSLFFNKLCWLSPSWFVHCFTSGVSSVAKAACVTEVIYADIHLEAFYLNGMLRNCLCK